MRKSCLLKDSLSKDSLSKENVLYMSNKFQSSYDCKNAVAGVFFSQIFRFSLSTSRIDVQGMDGIGASIGVYE